MKILVDPSVKTPLYQQIVSQIRGQILSGALPSGFRLPPERRLAIDLRVNRTTVLNAYRELKTEGLIEARVGDGTCVLAKPAAAAGAEPSPHEPAWNQIFSRRSSENANPIVQDLLALASRKDVISFATGIAAPELGPYEAFAGIERALTEQREQKPVLHAPTEGFLSLREAICGLMRRRGVYCRADEVVVLAGSQQGIDLVARILLDPDDLVIVEAPTYFPALQTFRAAGARVMAIPTDETGMRLDWLEELLQRYRPKLIYTMPTFHNPTGSEMPLANRLRLLELARRYRVLILEDDAYGDLCYEGEQLPLLKALEQDGLVIYLSTFSKNVFSGLRLGWLVAHRPVVRMATAAKQITDLHTSSLSQWIIERFITSGGLDAHMPRICAAYRDRRDVMLDTLAASAPPGMAWNRPRGGYYIWCTLPAGVSASALVQAAAVRKVVFVPGGAFYTDGQGDDQIRLNFTFAPLADIRQGIRLLCAAVDELLARPDKTAATIGDISPIV